MFKALRLQLAGPMLPLLFVLSLIAPAPAHADGMPAGYDPQWNLKAIQVQKAWNITRGNGAMVVAVIDTGVDSTHSEFAGRLVPGRNFAGGNDTNDTQGHGTFVAGIIAGATTGVAPNVKIMPLKVFDNSGYSSNKYIAEAIRWGVNQGVKVFNLSLGGLRETDELSDAIRYAYSQGALLICAAGNSGNDAAGSPIPYPAASKGSFAVAATTWDDKPAFYSSAGTWVKVSAPGGDYSDSYAKDPLHSIYGAQPGNKMGQYDRFVGTSFAAPHAAGLAALIWSVNPDLTNGQVEQIMMRTADRVWQPDQDRTDRMGFGRINAYRAVLAALPQDYRISVAAPTPSAPDASTVTIAGWAANTKSQYGPLIESVEVYVDGPAGRGTPLGRAQFPMNPSSLPVSMADAPKMDDCGFSFTWDTAAADAGVHEVYVGAKTLAGEWIWGQVAVTVTK